MPASLPAGASAGPGSRNDAIGPSRVLPARASSRGCRGGGARGRSGTSSIKAISFARCFHRIQPGRPGAPIDFVDTTVLPDKGRTEFGKKKNRVVQANAGDRGWKYDGPRGALTPRALTRVRAFQLYVRGNLDNVLRIFWRGDGVRLRYLGGASGCPGSGGRRRRKYSDGFRVEILFDPTTNCPSSPATVKGPRAAPPARSSRPGTICFIASAG